MNICLINPAWHFISKNDIVYSNNLGLGYIAAYLSTHGQHRITFIDSLFEGHQQIETLADTSIRVGLSCEQVIERIPADTQLIGLTAPFSHLYEETESLCRAIKTALGHIPLVIGGVHASTCPQDYLHSQADYWVIGEGERAMNALAQGQPPQSIPGLLSRQRPHPQDTGRAEQIHALDDIPFPARHLMPMHQYAQLSPRRIRHKASASIITSRGCPWDCKFCSIHPMYGYRWRKRSAENVLSEIEELAKTYHIRQFEFEDDNLTLHRQRAHNIFRGLEAINRKFNHEISWGAPNGIRSETVDRETLELMRRSGCVRVTFALEHGDEAIRELMGKKLDLAKFEQAVHDALESGLHVEVFTIVGYPGETRQRFENAVRYYKKLKKWGVSTIHFFYPQPYPGTQLNQYCRDRGYLVGGDRQLIPQIKIETEDFDSAEVIRRRDYLLSQFDRSYRLRQRVKAILPQTIINTINRYLPQRAM